MLTFIAWLILFILFYTLLAAGYFGFDTVPSFLDTYSAVQITGYSGGWRF
jgi:hypothetical protein